MPSFVGTRSGFSLWKKSLMTETSDQYYPGFWEFCQPSFRSAVRRAGEEGKCWRRCSRKLRPDFTEPHDRWMRSGQGDPDRFPDFLPRIRGELTAKSKRLLMSFTVCGCGTPAVNDDFMNMVSKVLTFADRRGYEEGFDELDDAMAEIPETFSIPTSSGSRKRQKARWNGRQSRAGKSHLGNHEPRQSSSWHRFKSSRGHYRPIRAIRSYKKARNLDNEGLSTRTLPEDDEELQVMMKEHYLSAKSQLRRLLNKTGQES